MGSKIKTIGEMSTSAYEDTSSYCAFDVANEITKDVNVQIAECISKHREVFELLDEFCVVMLIATDPLLKNMTRRKFYAWPFLPKPRTSQTVWHYNKRTDKINMLWCLPTADTMASLTLMNAVDPAYMNMKRWSGYFYTTKFWEKIRQEHHIGMLSEEEHLEIVRKEGTELLGNDISPAVTNPFDAQKLDSEQVTDS